MFSRAGRAGLDRGDHARERLGGRAPGVEPVEHEAEQHLGVAVAVDAGAPAVGDQRAQLVADAVVVAVDDAVQREQPAAVGDERRVARLLDRRSR